MPLSDGFLQFVLEQLGGLGAVSHRRMFGGAGLYAGGVFFGVLDDDQVFFRVDQASRPDYERAGSRPFAPIPGAAPMRGYYAVPPDVLEDRDGLIAWARTAVRVGAAAGKKKAAGKGSAVKRRGKAAGKKRRARSR